MESPLKAAETEIVSVWHCYAREQRFYPASHSPTLYLCRSSRERERGGGGVKCHEMEGTTLKSHTVLSPIKAERRLSFAVRIEPR